MYAGVFKAQLGLLRSGPDGAGQPPALVSFVGRDYVLTGKSEAHGPYTSHEYESLEDGKRTGRRLWRNSVTGQLTPG